MFSGIFDMATLPSWVGHLTGLVIFVAMVIGVLKAGFNFHENEIVRKRSLRLKAASKAELLSDDEEQFLDNSKMVERLKLTTNIQCSPNQAKLVHLLYNTGEFPIVVIKLTLPFLSLVDGKVKAHMDKFNTAASYVSGLTALCFLVYSYYVTFKIGMYSGDPYKLIAGLIVFAFCSLFSLWVGKTFKAKRNFDWVVSKLKEIDLYHDAYNEEGSIKQSTAPAKK